MTDPEDVSSDNKFSVYIHDYDNNTIMFKSILYCSYLEYYYQLYALPITQIVKLADTEGDERSLLATQM